ncbi:MAG: hypothetical protein EXS48_01400 [Candidatus Staskawiczbacteria bacterium]|nr:hypothetical protein [Candidatus Staskawiczbacteria bacterium]
MTKGLLNTLKRFYSYQKERFPLVILVISLLPAILSSGAVISANLTISHILISLLFCVAYLFHIRVIDERRDYDHDTKHHVERPVQTGLISNQELKKLDLFVIAIILITAFVSGIYSTILAVLMLSYSYLAGKEFFLDEKIRKHFFIYNAINFVQMLFLQIFIYSVFAGQFLFSNLILSHFLFTLVGSLIFEFVRKLKIPGHDGTGRDTYTFYLGFKNAIIAYFLLASLNTLLFFRVTSLISTHAFIWLIFSVFSITIISISAMHHWKKRTKTTDQLLQGNFLLFYALFNIIIYLVKLY